MLLPAVMVLFGAAPGSVLRLAAQQGASGESAVRTVPSYRPNDLQPNYRLKENTDVRLRLQHLFRAPLAEVLEAPQTIYSQRDGNLPAMFQIRLSNNQPDKLYYAFVNRSYDGQGNIVYPVSSQGTYLIRRDLREDQIDQIKIFLNQNIGGRQSFIRISRPENGSYGMNLKNELEVVIFDRPVYLQVPISIPFEDILAMPLRQLLQLTSQTIDWSRLLSDPTLKEWQLVRQIPDQIRPLLYKIPEVEGAAMDLEGRFVDIQSGKPLNEAGLDSFGFAKWIADGVYRSHNNWKNEPLYLDIEQLKRPQIELRGENNPWSNNTQDPYFGLDWARAIAHALIQAERPTDSPANASDVRELPFFRYLENIGYPIADIHAMMYLLAVKNPGFFYLGAINGPFIHADGTDQPESPLLHQYYREVVFFPYFQADGTFELVVMDGGAERSEDLLQYEGAYVHLSRIKAPYSYRPPPLRGL